MAFSNDLGVDKEVAAYNPVPVIFDEGSLSDELGFFYLTYIVYDQWSPDQVAGRVYDGQYLTELESTSTNHDFVVGDKVYINNNSNDNVFSGEFTILEISAADKITINRPFGAGKTFGGGLTCDVWRYRKLKTRPDVDNGKANIDIQRVLKDYINTTIEDSNSTYRNIEGHFTFRIIAGYEYVYSFEFDDNFFVSADNTVGFKNGVIDGGSLLSELPFEVGNVLDAVQEPISYSFTGFADDSGSLQLTGFSAVNFAAGDSVYISEIADVPSYNGFAEVTSVGGSTITVNKTWLGGTSEAGVVVGIPVTENGGTFVLQDTAYDGTNGTELYTDKAWTTSTQAVPGKIYYADRRSVKFLNEYIQSTDSYALDVGVKREDYSDLTMSDYRLASSSQKFLTNLHRSVNNYVRKEDKFWISAYSIDDDTITDVRLDVTVTGGTTYKYAIKNSFDNSGTDDDDVTIMIPGGLQQYVDNPGTFVWVGGTPALSTIVDDVETYVIYTWDDVAGQVTSESLPFEIRECASSDYLDKKTLIYKDRFGSYPSFNFDLVSSESVEVNKEHFYKKEGTFGSDSFTISDVDRGETTFYSKARNKWKLTTDWIREVDNKLIEDLLGSTDVYMMDEDRNLFPVRVLNESVVLKTDEVNELINYEMEVTIAYDNIRY